MEGRGKQNSDTQLGPLSVTIFSPWFKVMGLHTSSHLKCVMYSPLLENSYNGINMKRNHFAGGSHWKSLLRIDMAPNKLIK